MNTPLYIAALAFLILAVSAWAFILTVRAIIEHREKRQQPASPAPPRIVRPVLANRFKLLAELPPVFRLQEVVNVYNKHGLGTYDTINAARKAVSFWADKGLIWSIGRGYYRKIKQLQPGNAEKRESTTYAQGSFNFEQTETTNKQ